MPDLRGPYKLFFRGGAISEEYVRGELEIEYEHGSPLLGLRFSGYILLTRADDRSQERRDITGRYSFPDRAYFTDADMSSSRQCGRRISASEKTRTAPDLREHLLAPSQIHVNVGILTVAGAFLRVRTL